MLYANTITPPGLLQSLFGYDATTSGLVLSPSGVFAIIMLVIVGRLLGRGVDARYLMAAGLFVLGRRGLLDVAPESGNQSMADRLAARGVHHGSLHDFRAAQRRRLSCTSHRNCAAPRSVCSRSCAMKAAASELRVAQTIQERRDQFHSLRLGENLDPLNPAVNSYSRTSPIPVFFSKPATRWPQSKWRCKPSLICAQQQSSALAYFDSFFFFASSLSRSSSSLFS